MQSSVKCGKERGDGKDQISLAVSLLEFDVRQHNNWDYQF